MRKDHDTLTALRSTKYLGSHPLMPSQVDKIDIEFTNDGVRFVRGFKSLMEVPWASVTNLTADSRESLERRFSNLSVLFLGAYGLLARQIVSYLVIRDQEGDWVFAVPGLSAVELESGLKQLQPFVPERNDEPPGQSASFADRLRELESLLNESLVSESEYEQKRSAILDQI